MILVNVKIVRLLTINDIYFLLNLWMISIIIINYSYNTNPKFETSEIILSEENIIIT